MGRAWGPRGGAFVYVMAPALHKVDVSGLLAGGRQRLILDEQVKLEPFEGIAFPQPAQVHLELQAAGEILEIAGAVDVRLQGDCVRCLGVVSRDLHIEVTEELETGPEAQGDPLGESNVLAGDRLDVGYLTTQLVCSAIPIGLLCKEDCRGICPLCGENKNTKSCTCA